MEFHDVLHGHIVFETTDPTASLLQDLLSSPEINRLRNMRQMNFDVPLIQELGRSRRLPHSIGVAHVAVDLAKRCGLSLSATKTLLAGAILHDAAIPPYGHLVESEFKNAGIDFRHEKRVEELIWGTMNEQNKYLAIVPGRSLQLSEILIKNDVNPQDVIRLICPPSGNTPISADLDIDNIDNIHRMAVMLGWEGVKVNLKALIKGARLRELGPMIYSASVHANIEQWLDYRQRIYTLIIGHPECLPYNALQSDLVRIGVADELITPRDWFLSEPVFEEILRGHEKSRQLANQLISGCEYQLVDYSWFKGFQVTEKLTNGQILLQLRDSVDCPHGYDYFVWNEKGLISRQIRVTDEHGETKLIGTNSTSCMIALVKKTSGKARWSKADALAWRRRVTDTFISLFGSNEFDIDFPETYSGEFLGRGNNELKLGYH